MADSVPIDIKIRRLKDAGPIPKALLSELRRLIAKHIRHQADAEDLLQSVVVRFLLRDPDCAVDNPEAYLRQMTVNAIAEYRRAVYREIMRYDSELVEKEIDGGVAEA